MSFWADLKGTTESIFRIGLSKLSLDASGLTAARTVTAPDRAGTLALAEWLAKTADYTAVNGDKIQADTTNGAFTIYLPASPSAGQVVGIKCGPAVLAYALTIDGNGSTIATDYTAFTADVPNAEIWLVFNGSTWRM